MGWGGFLDKAMDLFGTRAERRRNRINVIKKEMAQILKEKSTLRNLSRYERLSGELGKLQNEAANN